MKILLETEIGELNPDPLTHKSLSIQHYGIHEYAYDFSQLENRVIIKTFFGSGRGKILNKKDFT